MRLPPKVALDLTTASTPRIEIPYSSSRAGHTGLFRRGDEQQMQELGIGEEQILSQIKAFQNPDFHLRLVKPCTTGDGVYCIEAEESEEYIRLQMESARDGRFLAFVPASGAATRMFQSLLQLYYMPQFMDPDVLHRKAERGVALACDFIKFIKGLKDLAFSDELRAVLLRDGHELCNLVYECRFGVILDYLLTERGLDYGSIPKGILKFHRYSTESRTAFEEHLTEAAGYVTDGAGICRLHFTLSPEHEYECRDFLSRVLPKYEDRLGVKFDISFSLQEPSTNTIAVDMENRPFRDRSGRLLFRPGGHGALIGNLNHIVSDFVYIKNIDNVAMDHFKPTVIYWKQVLGGFLLSLQTKIHAFVRALRERGSEEDMAEAALFAREKLFFSIPEEFGSWPPQQRRAFLLGKLHRPIRVCGLVPNAGQPGGAPFFVEDARGDVSIQIVEKAQVDLTVPEQLSIWSSSTHFNPVDLVCALQDVNGSPFDLKEHVNQDAVFISKKSKDGKDIKALELPGLWNGAMAEWITVLVEVPAISFNPVKTIFDLLRPEHRS